ncbi:MAG: hypothetical protein LBS94_04915, partial [Prevotellaceae bacterium]|nr:hypothetical protein [Prevotellaceae bacterium]
MKTKKLFFARMAALLSIVLWSASTISAGNLVFKMDFHEVTAQTAYADSAFYTEARTADGTRDTLWLTGAGAGTTTAAIETRTGGSTGCNGGAISFASSGRYTVIRNLPSVGKLYLQLSSGSTGNKCTAIIEYSTNAGSTWTALPKAGDNGVDSFPSGGCDEYIKANITTVPTWIRINRGENRSMRVHNIEIEEAAPAAPTAPSAQLLFTKLSAPQTGVAPLDTVGALPSNYGGATDVSPFWVKFYPSGDTLYGTHNTIRTFATQS